MGWWEGREVKDDNGEIYLNVYAVTKMLIKRYSKYIRSLSILKSDFSHIWIRHLNAWVTFEKY